MGGFQLQNLRGEEGGWKRNSDLNTNKTNSKPVSRMFWWDKKDGSGNDSDSESTDRIMASPALPGLVESTPPSTGIMKSTSVTVSIQQAYTNPDASGSARRDSLLDRGVGQLGSLKKSGS